MNKHRLALLAGLSAAVLLLAGCSVSDSERAACEERGGTVTSERFTYSSGFLNDRRTGRLHFCESSNGAILEVYNELITEVNEGFLGTSGDNITIFNECNRLNGETFRTRYSSGKSTFTRFACVVDGSYRQILS